MERMNNQEHDLESSGATMNGNPSGGCGGATDGLINITDSRKLPRTSGTVLAEPLSDLTLTSLHAPAGGDIYGGPTTAATATAATTTTTKAAATTLANLPPPSSNEQPKSSTTKAHIDTKKRVHFKSLFASSTSVINASDGIARSGGQELINFNNLNLFDGSPATKLELQIRGDAIGNGAKEVEEEDDFGDTSLDDEDDNDDYDHVGHGQQADEDQSSGTALNGLRTTINHCDSSPSRHKHRHASSRLSATSSGVIGRLSSRLNSLTNSLANKLWPTSDEVPYASVQECDNNKDLLTGATKYKFAGASGGRRARRPVLSASHTFRGSYKYSRAGIAMAIFAKLINFLGQKSTLALLGAFLIHVTLGTVYTLSNINSYLTSYMRTHGTPGATYGGSMWISSSYAVGQGISMVLGGYLERRFSARLSCFLGCALHSLSIMSTSKSIDHGQLPVLVTYGFLPGFGCGLAYMTPMSNGFGWFPNRKGLVAGVILAGFGIGTFVFNMAQTAFVNPENLSPLAESGGYFTQESILDRVPQLFVFLGCIYASMQFIGCCLLFKPPSSYETGSKSSDTKPILVESEMSFRRAIRSREFIVLFLVFGITNQGVLFVNSMLKEYGQIFINNDLFLAWTGSMASIANSLGRLSWGLAIDRFSFTQCFTAITTIFGALMFLMPFEFVLSSKLLYLLCTLGIFGSFSGWMSTYPVHLSRVFGVHNSGIIYGLIFVSQSIGGIFTAFGAHYLIDNYSRFVPFFCVAFLEVLGLAIYHLFYNRPIN